MSSDAISTVKLSTLASFQEGYVNPSQREPRYFDGPIKWLRATDLNDSLVSDTSRTLSTDGFQSAGKSALLFEPGTLAISKSGTIGRLGILGDYMCGNRAVINIKPNSNVVPRYLFFVLRHMRPVIEVLAEGSVQKNLYVSTLGNLDVPAPSKNVQLKIAGILGALDDRITLLRETNATLEAIAQALFKSWFVDFDPVRANAEAAAQGSAGAAEGKTPSAPLDPATAALFPNRLTDSPLGLIPEGWRVLSFTETVNVVGGGTPKTSIAEYWDGDIPWYSVVDAPAVTDVFVIDTEKHITEVGLKNSSTKLLSAGTTIISARGTVGKLALVGRDMAMNQSCYGLQGKSGDAYFTYFSTFRLIETLKQRTHGSVFDTITRDTLSGVAVAYPPAPVIQAFEEMLNPVMKRIKENLIQAQTIATLRDTLLPRLISGQLRINDASIPLNA